MISKPFWEEAFEDVDAPSPFGGASSELSQLLPSLPENASVLDLGCGDGRNALFFARQGCNVKAIDISRAAISKLNRHANRESLDVSGHIADLRDYKINGMYDLVIAHGCLHLLERHVWTRLIEETKEHTQIQGYNVSVVFTDTLPPPEDLQPWMKGLFKEGELFSYYSDWQIFVKLSYVLEDEHPGGIKHRHPINKLVAKRVL